MPEVSDKSKILELAFKEAKSALDVQEKIHSSVITRASIAGGLNTILASTLAARALSEPPNNAEVALFSLSPMELLGLGCLVGSLVFAYLAVTPRAGWKLYYPPTMIFKLYCDGPDEYTIDHVHRYMAEHFEENRNQNEKIISKQLMNVQIAFILAVAQALFWVLDVR